MKIREALRPVQRLYIETAPLIYYVEAHPTYLERMDTVIKAIDDGAIKAYSSVITLTEVLSHPIKRGNQELERKYRDILVNGSGYQLMGINLPIAELAASLRARYNLRTPDALHLASAIHYRSDAFLTNDMGIKRVTEITILILDELE